MKSWTNAFERWTINLARRTVGIVALSSAVAPLVRAQESDPNQSGLRAHFPPAPAVVEVPFRYEVGKILVEVQVSGSKPLLFVLDSGAGSAVLLKPEKIEGLGIELTGAAEVAGAGGSQAARYASGVHFDIGGLRLEGANLVVMPADGPEHLRKYPWDGVFGAEVFSSAVVGIDWANRRLRLEPPETFTASAGAVAVPLEKQGSHVYVSGEVAIDGQPRQVRLVVDTGAAHALALHPEKVPLPARRLSDVTVGRGLGGALKGDIGRVDRLRIGGSDLSAVVTTFPRTTAEVVTVGADGNLGTEVLRRFAVTFDYARSRMLLLPTEAVAEPFSFSTAGVRTESWIAADGSVGVDDVYAGSPAALAGIEVGDRILSVDALPARELGVDGVRARLSQAPGTHIKLEVRRAESVREAELELALVL